MKRSLLFLVFALLALTSCNDKQEEPNDPFQGTIWQTEIVTPDEGLRMVSILTFEKDSKLTTATIYFQNDVLYNYYTKIYKGNYLTDGYKVEATLKGETFTITPKGDDKLSAKYTIDKGDGKPTKQEVIFTRKSTISALKLAGTTWQYHSKEEHSEHTYTFSFADNGKYTQKNITTSSNNPPIVQDIRGIYTLNGCTIVTNEGGMSRESYLTPDFLIYNDILPTGADNYFVHFKK